MLINAKSLKGFKLLSRDGEIGKVKDFYFDDHQWTVRYLVADTGGWLTGRQVLISPHAVLEINQEEQSISIDLTKMQIESSPSIDSAKPVSRQFEGSFYGYYGYPTYWENSIQSQFEEACDPHLRSTQNVTGYHVEATDGAIGHVDDFIIDNSNWKIRYFVIETKNWRTGKKVLISPEWVERVRWSQSNVFINLLRETIRLSPEFLGQESLNIDYETRLFGHYNKRGYWIEANTHHKLTPGLISKIQDGKNFNDNDDERERNETHRGIT